MSGRRLSRAGSSCLRGFPSRATLWLRITGMRTNARAFPRSGAGNTTTGEVSTSCRQSAAEIRGRLPADLAPHGARAAAAWGFNTIGNWSEPRLLERHEMPYVVPIHAYGNFARVSSGSDWWGKMPDPFDPAFAAAVDALAAKAASTYRQDPYLIGYFVDNELACIAQLTERYRDAEHLAAAWGIAAHSWDELREANIFAWAAASRSASPKRSRHAQDTVTS